MLGGVRIPTCAYGPVMFKVYRRGEGVSRPPEQSLTVYLLLATGTNYTLRADSRNRGGGHIMAARHAKHALPYEHPPPHTHAQHTISHEQAAGLSDKALPLDPCLPWSYLTIPADPSLLSCALTYITLKPCIRPVMHPGIGTAIAIREPLAKRALPSDCHAWAHTSTTQHQRLRILQISGCAAGHEAGWSLAWLRCRPMRRMPRVRTHARTHACAHTHTCRWSAG